MGQFNDIFDDGDLMIQFQVKVLEQQLEQEHEERINFLRERHELEGKIMGLQVNRMFKTSPEISPVRLIKSNLFHFQDLLDRSGDEEQVAKLKKDLIMLMILMMMMMMMMLMMMMMIRQ